MYRSVYTARIPVYRIRYAAFSWLTVITYTPAVVGHPLTHRRPSPSSGNLRRAGDETGNAREPNVRRKRGDPKETTAVRVYPDDRGARASCRMLMRLSSTVRAGDEMPSDSGRGWRNVRRAYGESFKNQKKTTSTRTRAPRVVGRPK